MTVSTTTNRVDYAGAGSAGPFPVPFPFYDSSHLTCIQTDINGNETTLAGWTTTGAGDPTGTVTLAAVVPVGSTLAILRRVPLTQATSVKNQEAFYPEIHEKEFDLLAMADQQAAEEIGRSLRLPYGASGVDLTLPKPDAGHALVWNATETGLENAGTASATLQQDLSDSVDIAKGDALIAVKQPFAGAVARTQHDKNTEWVSVLDFGAVGDGVADDTGAMVNALMSGCNIHGNPGDTYKITGQLDISSFVCFDGRNSVINAILPINTTLFNITSSAIIKNITIDFNNGYCGCALNFPTKDVGYLELVKVSIKNIYDLDNTTLMKVLNINTDGNILEIDGLSIKNVKKLSDGNSTSIGGGIEVVYIYLPTSDAVALGGYIDNVEFENIRTVNISGADVEDICNAIYMAYAPSIDPRARITINNVNALDYGRRLFKLQCNDLIISNVFANSVSLPAFACIGIQDMDISNTFNVKVNNAIIRGAVRFGIVCGANDTVLNCVDISTSLVGSSGPYGTSSIGIFITGDNLTISNSHIRTKTCLYNGRAYTSYAGSIKNLNINNTYFYNNESGGLFGLLGDTASVAVIDTCCFSDCIFDASEFPSYLLIGNTTNKGGVISFNNCILIDNDSSANGGSFLQVKGMISALMSNFVHYNKNATSLVYRSLRFDTCNNVSLNGINILAAPNSSSIDLNVVDTFNVNGLHVPSSATYNLVLTAVASSRLSNLDRSRIFFATTTVKKGAVFAPEFGFGTTVNRPTSGLIVGYTYWDETLNKPIWWNGSVWKDAAGTTV